MKKNRKGAYEIRADGCVVYSGESEEEAERVMATLRSVEEIHLIRKVADALDYDAPKQPVVGENVYGVRADRASELQKIPTLWHIPSGAKFAITEFKAVREDNVYPIMVHLKCQGMVLDEL